MKSLNCVGGPERFPLCLGKGEERKEFVATLAQACYDPRTTLAPGTLEGRVSGMGSLGTGGVRDAMEVIADLRKDMFRRLPLEITQLVDTTALHCGTGPHLADRAPQPARAQELEPSLGDLIHHEVRVAIEMAVHEELCAALGTTPYERSHVRRGYRNGTKTRTLTGPTGPIVLTLPRATLFAGAQEWTSKIVPRYQRRLPEVNEAIVATYLAGGNTRRIRGALQPLRKTAPLSKSAVSAETELG